MSELIELEKEATESLDGIELNNKTMQRPQGNNPMLNVDASAKVVVSDNKLEANMCVFSPQFSGKDITVEAMRQALKDAHVVYGIDEELLEEIKKYPSEEVYCIGGDSVYKQLLPYCDTAHVTKIDFGYEADSYFPNLDEMPEWKITAESDEQTYFDLEYSFVKYERVK